MRTTLMNFLPQLNRGLGCLIFVGMGLALSLAAADVDDERRLLDLALQKKRLFEIVAERPDFFTEEQLAERLDTLSDAFAEYVADYPSDVMGLILWARLLQIMDRNEAALQLFRKADELDSEIAVVKQQIGNHLAESGEGIAALSYLFRAVELEPEQAVYHYQLGELLDHFREDFLNEAILSRSDLDSAMQRAFREAAHLQPEDFDLQMRYGESYYDVENPDWEQALKHWQAMEAAETEVFREQVILLHVARVLIELERAVEALEALEDIRHSSLRASRDALVKRIQGLFP
jgi:tetratricopeptide (TPR) repeat protein